MFFVNLTSKCGSRELDATRKLPISAHIVPLRVRPIPARERGEAANSKAVRAILSSATISVRPDSKLG
jgi:hypothetical protein